MKGRGRKEDGYQSILPHIIRSENNMDPTWMAIDSLTYSVVYIQRGPSLQYSTFRRPIFLIFLIFNFLVGGGRMVK